MKVSKAFELFAEEAPEVQKAWTFCTGNMGRSVEAQVQGALDNVGENIEY